MFRPKLRFGGAEGNSKWSYNMRGYLSVLASYWDTRIATGTELITRRSYLSIVLGRD
jgi:hypothetical protein